MKNVLLAFVLLSTFFTSCDKEDGSSPISPADITGTITSGTWRITYYWDTDRNETSNFSGYGFTFNSNGTVVAVKGTSTINGTWSTGTDDNKVKLILNFASPSDFVEISDDWHTIERTSTMIRLQDVSGGNGGTDYLTFEKN